MDLEAIESNLAACVEKSEGIDVRDAEHAAYWTIVSHGDDLLRLVRAMRWMEANNADITCDPLSMAMKWCCETGSCCGEHSTPLAAIEAAMQSK